ncbi:MAG: 3-oxoacyl-ACP synthase, partial [bacterium]
RRAMELALREARVEPHEVDYINAHATGTPVGDVAEVRAIDELFSGCTPFLSSTKGATGHLLGAAGALEAAYTVQAIRTGCIPGTTGLTLESVDPACSPRYATLLAAERVETSVSVAISNSFAFGGHNATLVFRRYSN